MLIIRFNGCNGERGGVFSVFRLIICFDFFDVGKLLVRMDSNFKLLVICILLISYGFSVCIKDEEFI